MRSERPVHFDAVICDLDNTLYDWVGFYVPAFLAMAEEASRIGRVPLDDIIDSFGVVHRRYRTTEYTFALQDLPVLSEADRALPTKAFLAKYDDAIHAYRSVRKRRLRLYDGVRETLADLKAAGIVLVAHSDSLISHAGRRLRQLDVDTFFELLAAPPDHPVPSGISIDDVRRVDAALVEPRVRTLALPEDVRKPDPRSLRPVLDELGMPADRILYVGNSLFRDVSLANRLGVRSAWARYGEDVDQTLFSTLLRVTYWTADDVAEDLRNRESNGTVIPSYTIDSFGEVGPICGLDGKPFDADGSSALATSDRSQ